MLVWSVVQALHNAPTLWTSGQASTSKWRIMWIGHQGHVEYEARGNLSDLSISSIEEATATSSSMTRTRIAASSAPRATMRTAE